MKKLISLLLCCLMLASLMTACGGSKDTGIVGNWKVSVPLADHSEMGDLGEMAEYIDEDKLVLGFNLTFTKDGKYTLAVDTKSVDKLIDIMCDGMESYLKDMSKALGLDVKDIIGDMTVYEFMKATGDLEAFEQLKEMTTSGEYTYENGILTMNGEEKDIDLNGNTLTIELEGQTMTFKRK